MEPEPRSGQRLIELGWVAGAHGLRGEVALRLHHADSSILSPGRTLLLESEQGTVRATVATARPGTNGVLVRFEGVSDRTAAEPLRGRRVVVPFSELPPTADDEFYYDELTGFAVSDETAGPVGVVQGVFATHVDNLVVLAPDGREHIIPFVDAFVIAVDRAARTVAVGLPEGFLELATGGGRG